jgi:hypothetical protein
VISSAIDEILVDRQRAAVHFGIRQRPQHPRQRHRVLDRVGKHASGAPALVAREPAPVLGRVDLDLLMAEDELDALAGPRGRDRVAAALEAEQAIASDDARRALDDQIGRGRQRAQRGAVAFGADRDEFAVRAMHAPAGDVLVPGPPRPVGVLVAGEGVGAQQPLAHEGDV